MALADTIRENLQPFAETAELLPRIAEIVSDAEFVLIGEASHGTHEFYQCRAAITQHLISEMGFSAVAVEADLPDAYRVNRYVTCRGNDASADEALGDFSRFPLWMWRNTDVLDFVDWLRAHNELTDSSCGFYGLDLYSLHSSMDAVLKT
jgi:erythromycin esterase-like protein